MSYTSIKERWEKDASIRIKPRRSYQESDTTFDIFPLHKQPLCIHPLIQQLPAEICNYILIQSAYYYLYNIALIETELVNSVALTIANNRTVVKFPEEMCQDALTIIIDEAYHAYVAMDFINQVKTYTQIQPLKLQSDSDIHVVAKKCIEHQPKDISDIFMLIVVCLSEHTLTQEIAGISRESNVCQYFIDIMKDHLIDEGRHVSYFYNILKFTWSQLDTDIKNNLAPLLGEFLLSYSKNSQQLMFENQLLNEIGLTSDEIDKVLKDTYIKQNATNSIIDRYLTVLQKTGVLEHKGIYSELVKCRLINN